MRHPLRPLLLIALCGPLFAGDPADAQPASSLRSFYAQVPVDSGDDIVSVEPIGPDVRVRVIRVGLAHELCAGKLVQAIERILPRTTVQAVAGVTMCSMSKQQVARALARAPYHYQYIDFFGRTDTVVATCGKIEKVFAFRQPPNVDRKKVRRQAPAVAALWNMGLRVRAMVTEHAGDDPFVGATPDVQTAREALGTSLLSELVSGKFEAGFHDWCWDRTTERRTACLPNYLAWELDGYTGPPVERGPRPVELLERESLNLISYVAPIMPAIAISARVFGDVRLRITADANTGLVSDVQVITGSPLHVEAALKAARAWRFATGAAPREPVDVTLRFQLRCAEN